MPIIWHNRFGIQGLKSVTTASPSNPAFVAQCANTYHFQAHTKRRLFPSRYPVRSRFCMELRLLVYRRIDRNRMVAVSVGGMP